MSNSCYVSGIIFGKTKNITNFFNYYNEELSFNDYWESVVISTELIPDSNTTSKLYFNGFIDKSAKCSLLEESESYENLTDLAKKFSIHFEFYSENSEEYFQEYAYINNLGELEYTVVDYVVFPLYPFEDEDEWYKDIQSLLLRIEQSEYLIDILKEFAEDININLEWTDETKSRDIEIVLRNLFRYHKKNNNDSCSIGGCPENIPYRYEAYTKDAVKI